MLEHGHAAMGPRRSRSGVRDLPRLPLSLATRDGPAAAPVSALSPSPVAVSPRPAHPLMGRGIRFPRQTCVWCQYTWQPATPQKPRACARCHRWQYDVPPEVPRRGRPRTRQWDPQGRELRVPDAR